MLNSHFIEGNTESETLTGMTRVQTSVPVLTVKGLVALLNFRTGLSDCLEHPSSFHLAQLHLTQNATQMSLPPAASPVHSPVLYYSLLTSVPTPFHTCQCSLPGWARSGGLVRGSVHLQGPAHRLKPKDAW